MPQGTLDPSCRRPSVFGCTTLDPGASLLLALSPGSPPPSQWDVMQHEPALHHRRAGNELEGMMLACGSSLVQGI